MLETRIRSTAALKAGQAPHIKSSRSTRCP